MRKPTAFVFEVLILSSLGIVDLNRSVARAAEASRPNIILILSDDMGFSDLGCYGGEIKTPNLDALASDGLRFTQFYNGARCCPTRASLLTGLYAHQAGVGNMTGGNSRLESYAGNLNNRCVTIAEALKPAGYHTYMVGEWHVARDVRPTGPKDTWPMQRGFDKFYGTLDGAGSYYDPASLCRGNTFITPENDPEYRPAKFYYTDAIADNAVKFLQEHGTNNPGAPFFLYVAFTAAHWPMQAPAEEVAKYKGAYDAGYSPIRAARFAKSKQLGLINRDWELSTQAGDWDRVGNKTWEARCMEVYAAMIDRMDQNVGKIVAELKRQGRFDNTLILFLQDNGACAENMGRQSNAEQVKSAVYKPFGPDDLQPQIWPPMQTRDGRPVRTGPDVMPGPEDTYMGYGRSWANVSDTPFREYKHWVHEGGISTPLIAHWPAGIPSPRRNQLVTTPAHLIDIMATCLDIGAARYPSERGGQMIPPPEGVSLRPVFADQPLQRTNAIFWEHEGNRAVRDGKWKLVAKSPRGSWELYDMEADRTEMHNLAVGQPEKVKALSNQWEVWAKRTGVLPWIWTPAYGATNRANGARTAVSSETRFELGPDADLRRAEAPDIAERAFVVSVEIAEAGRDGVLVAQGGASHGWSFYFKDGALCFAVRRDGDLEMVSAPANAIGQATIFAANLSMDGSVKLTANDKEIANGKVSGLLLGQPADGLQVGRDLAGAVGNYSAPFPFSGKLKSAVLSLEPR